MSNLDGVRDHDRATGLTERLKAALAVFGPEDSPLTPQQLGALDQFHTRGLAATAELAKLAGITGDRSVLDAGSGVGGPAPSPNCGVVMGPDFAQLAANLGRGLMAGQLGVASAVFEAL